MTHAHDLPDAAFLDRVVRPLDGWLDDFAALRTMEVLSEQEARGTDGPLIEIGVYRGKYFAVLLRAARRRGQRAIGIDPFQDSQRAVAEDGLRAHFGDGALDLVTASSRDFDGDGLVRLAGGRPRFVSVDGSHEAEDVAHDLAICAEALHEDGVVAADDFLNPLAIGVNEGVNRYFAGAGPAPLRLTDRLKRRLGLAPPAGGGPASLAPFAYAANKLFLCRPDRADAYRGRFEAGIAADAESWRGPHFVNQRAAGRSWVEQRLFGHLVLLAP